MMLDWESLGLPSIGVLQKMMIVQIMCMDFILVITIVLHTIKIMSTMFAL